MHFARRICSTGYANVSVPCPARQRTRNMKKLNDAQIIDVNQSTFFVLLLGEAAQNRFVQTTQSCLIAFPDETGRIVLQKNHSLEGEMKNGQRENAGMVGTSS